MNTPSQKRKRDQPLPVRLPQLINRMMSGGLNQMLDNAQTFAQSETDIRNEFSLTTIHSFNRMISSNLASNLSEILSQDESSPNSAQQTVYSFETQKILTDLTENCFNELLIFVETMAVSVGFPSTAIASYENLFMLSLELPACLEDLDKLALSKQGCFDVYGADFVDITRKYADKKKGKCFKQF